MLFARDQVLFLELFDLPDQKSKTIALAVAPLVQHLSREHLIVAAVCTDNASNEKAVLDPLNDYSLQQLTGLLILRVPCVAHTVTLQLSADYNWS
jgi:hypothetical protein